MTPNTQPPTNGRYEAGFTAAEVVNLKGDIEEIKENVQKLVDKQFNLELRVYGFAAAIAALTAKGAAVLGYLLGGTLMPPKPPAKGDLIKVHWADILEDSVGNPEVAKPAERISYALFWAREVRGPLECLVTTTTIDTDNSSQVGYCVYPWGAILKIEVIKRAKP